MLKDEYKQRIRETLAYRVYRSWLKRRNVADWRSRGCPAPPPHEIKVDTVRALAKRYGFKTMVETGTFMGSMIHGTRDTFDRIVSVELNPVLAERARKIFAHHPHIEIMEGDSAQLLPVILSTLKAPALFWLDAHSTVGSEVRAGEDSVIGKEIAQVLLHNSRHMVLVDDARLFVGKDGYPKLKEFITLVQSLRPGAQVRVQNDAVQIHPLD